MAAIFWESGVFKAVIYTTLAVVMMGAVICGVRPVRNVHFISGAYCSYSCEITFSPPEMDIIDRAFNNRVVRQRRLPPGQLTEQLKLNVHGRNCCLIIRPHDDQSNQYYWGTEVFLSEELDNLIDKKRKEVLPCLMDLFH